MLIEKVERYLESQIKSYPCNTNRASEIGHDCIRYLFFLRTRDNEKSLHDLGGEFIFREGREQERSVLRLLDEAGIEVLEQQRAFEWKEHLLTGHIDGKVMVDGEVMPIEIKSMAPWIFDKTDTLEDMLTSKQFWVRKYPAQMQMYLLMDEKEHGLFLLKNKSTGRLKEIPINLDYSYAEMLVQKAETVNGAVHDKKTPPPIDWCDICEKCGFRHICLQEVVRKEIEFVVDQELEEQINGYHELKPWHKQWVDLDEILKEKLRGVEKCVVGEWLVMGRKYGEKGWKISYQKL